jgi:ketosteroid isomerase-like protein
VSVENVEVVRRASGLVGRSCRDGVPSQELLALCAPDVRVDASRRVFNPEVYEGIDGLRRMIREISEAWEDFTESSVEIIDAGERVVELQTISGTGRSSGIAVQADGALIWTVRDGLVALVEVFADRDLALAYAGLAG